MVPENRVPMAGPAAGSPRLVLAVSSQGQGWERAGSRVFLWESHPHDLLRSPPNGPSANTIALGPPSMNWGWGDTRSAWTVRWRCQVPPPGVTVGSVV